jgi:hypothetical protein
MHHQRFTRSAIFLAAALAAACGPAPKAESPKTTTTPKDESVGAEAVAQGGVTSLTDTVQGSGTEAAINGPLRFEQIDPQSPVKLDGLLKEWPASFNAKRTDGGDAASKFSVSLQYDDQKVYVGGTINDPTPSHSKRMGEAEDHVSFVLAFPNAGQLSAYDIAIHPGVPGDYAGTVKFGAWGKKGEDVPGAKIVEAPIQGGLSFEAVIPWSTFPEARTMRVGMRGAVRYLDYDGPKLVATLGTGPGDAAHAKDLPSLPTEPEQAVLDNLLALKGIQNEVPKLDVYADVVGDGMKERISVFGRLLTVCGPTYREGKQFFYRDLGGELVRLDTEDATGRGKNDLIVRRRFPTKSGAREWLEILAFLQDEPSVVFSQEIAIASGANRVTSSVHVGKKEIEVHTEPAHGWDAGTFKEGLSPDTNELLLPWAAVKSRTFKFDGTKFVKASEVAQTPTPAAGASGGAVAGVGNQEPARELPHDVPTPEVKHGSDLGRELLALYRKDASVPDSVRPKVDLEVNVGGDARPERVLLIGRDIVVFGPGFRGGNQYARITLTQFSEADDIADLRARDLTGDGAADLVVSGARHLQSSAGDKVDVNAMFVYEIKGDSIARVFAIETGRSQGDKRVQATVQFIPAKSGKGFDVDARPGLARGWTEKTFPWRQEQPGSGPVEPLLLPWGGLSSVRYTYNGSEYAKAP